MISKLINILNLEDSKRLSQISSLINELDFETFNKYSLQKTKRNQYYIANIDNKEFGIVFNNDMFLFKANQIKKGDVSDFNIISLYKPTDCDLFPEDMELALNKTPMGIEAKNHLMQACETKYLYGRKKNKTKLNITIQDYKFQDGSGNELSDYAQTQPPIGFEKKWNLIVSTDNDERATNWNLDEKLNIIAVHESNHIIFNEELGALSTDFVGGNFTEGHIKHISEEFKARLEYSIIYSESDPKVNWIKSYFRWFTLYDIFLNENGIPLDLLSKKTEYNNSWEYEEYAVCYDGLPEFIDFCNIDYPLNSDIGKFEKGKKICYNLYQELAKGWTDEVLVKFKIDKELYLNDLEFDKIK